MLSKQAWGPRHGVGRAQLSAAQPCPPSAAGDLVPSRACPKGDPAAGHGGLHRPLSSAPGPPVPFTCISKKHMPHSEQAGPEPEFAKSASVVHNGPPLFSVTNPLLGSCHSFSKDETQSGGWAEENISFLV